MPKKPTKNSKSEKIKVKQKANGREHVSDVVEEVSEPFSLLNTLKEEGMANAMALFGLAGSLASGAAKNFRADTIKPQLYDLLTSMGFALREDIERLEARVEELEAKLSEKEFEAIRSSDDE